MSDKLLNIAAKSSGAPLDYNDEYVAIPRNLIKISKNTVYIIDKKLRTPDSELAPKTQA